MKLIFISLALIISIASAALIRKPNCDHESEGSGCPKIYRPVCGTDFRTYSSECMFCQYIQKSKHFELKVLHEGECTDAENKQGEYDPQMLAFMKKRQIKQTHP